MLKPNAAPEHDVDTIEDPYTVMVLVLALLDKAIFTLPDEMGFEEGCLTCAWQAIHAIVPVDHPAMVAYEAETFTPDALLDHTPTLTKN